jgi:hypothetical protein
MKTFKQYYEGQVSLKQQLIALRPLLAQAAQSIYNAWEEDDNSGGICDEISDAIAGVIVSHVADVEIQEGGQDGSDHSWVIAYNTSQLPRPFRVGAWHSNSTHSLAE